MSNASGASGPFTAVPLRLDAQADEGRYVAAVPQTIADSPAGFTYYAVIHDISNGATTTLPAGGADAPQQSLVLGSPAVVDLGAHHFGATRGADARVASASWGDGPRDVGLENGRNQAPIGASSFDVGAGGAVTLLDEAHRRLLRFSGSTVSAQPLAIDGTIADIAVAPGGGVYVLETGHVRQEQPRGILTRVQALHRHWPPWLVWY
jgi:hypothetical protein